MLIDEVQTMALAFCLHALATSMMTPCTGLYLILH